MVKAGHTAADRGDGGEQNLPLTSTDILFGGPAPQLTREYIQSLSLAFMQTYIGNRPEYQKYLSASYVNSMSQEPIQLDLVRSLTLTQLEQAYGSSSPNAFFPMPVTMSPANK
jgi:hypothetical protein